MTSPAEVMSTLEALVVELDTRSKDLAETERNLEPAEARYEESVGDWAASLWNEPDAKWPPEKLRLRMAHKAMDPQLLGAVQTGQAKRKRLEKRIGSIKVQVDAQRSILSALKAELEASS